MGCDHHSCALLRARAAQGARARRRRASELAISMAVTEELKAGRAGRAVLAGLQDGELARLAAEARTAAAADGEIVSTVTVVRTTTTKSMAVQLLLALEIVLLSAVLIALPACLGVLAVCILATAEVVSLGSRLVGGEERCLAIGLVGCLAAAVCVLASVDRHVYHCSRNKSTAPAQQRASSHELYPLLVQLALPAPKRPPIGKVAVDSAATHPETITVAELLARLVAGAIQDGAHVQAADRPAGETASHRTWVQLSTFIDIAALRQVAGFPPANTGLGGRAMPTQLKSQSLADGELIADLCERLRIEVFPWVRVSMPVTLNIYDWNGRVRCCGAMLVALNCFIGHTLGMGAWHSGVVLGGREYSYTMTAAAAAGRGHVGRGDRYRSTATARRGNGSSAGDGGVIRYRPRDPQCALPHRYRTSIFFGAVRLSELSKRALLEELKTTWRGEDYDLLSRNCNHFTKAFILALDGSLVGAYYDCGAAVSQQEDVAARRQRRTVRRVPAWLNRAADVGAMLRTAARFCACWQP